MTDSGTTLPSFEKVTDNLVNNEVIRIGAWDEPQGMTSGFVGNMDEVRFYNRALSASEIQAVAQ